MPPTVFCKKPFNTVLLFNSHGSIQVNSCCFSWMSSKGKQLLRPLLSFDSFHFDDIINSPYLKTFRRDMLKGNPSLCSKESCPFYGKKSTDDPTLKETVSPEDIRLELALDESCNLSCPSCRDHTINHPNKPTYRIIKAALKEGVSSVYLSGAGEFLVDRELVTFLNRMTEEDAPRLKEINIITNGTLFSESVYYAFSPVTRKALSGITVSIDSLQEDRYAILRRGGSLPRTLRNIEFLNSLRVEGKIDNLNLAMIVQKQNWDEVEDLLIFAEQKGITSVYLWELDNRANTCSSQGLNALENRKVKEMLNRWRHSSPLTIISPMGS